MKEQPTRLLVYFSTRQLKIKPMTDKTPQQIKQEALDMLARIVPQQSAQIQGIDPRLLRYYYGLQDPDLHNLYEILGGIKFLRILRTYPFSQKKVTHAIQLYEGRWHGDTYMPDSGGLHFSGLKGFTHYKLQPFQVFALAGLLGPQKETDGDRRRLCTELVLYLTRKSGKTLMSAFIQFYGFFFMDSNFEGYCCANSADQAKLLYKTAQTLIRQMDPTEGRIRFTASQTNWKPGQPRQASITALSAGGKTKDGLFAQLCCADEFGSADFTNGKSDMLDLVSVVQSSMGPRREPLTVITTTAGYATNGPFRRQLDIMQESLENELLLPDDCTDPQPDDYQHALLLQPDPWEQQDEEALLTDERIWRKSNPMIGISVQPSFYEQEAYKARMNADNRKEFITKLVNVYQSARVTNWIKAEDVRPLQRDMRIDDCTARGGWVIFTGLDFSMGDDFHGASWLAVRKNPQGRGNLFHADCDFWIKEESLEKSAIRPLLETWINQGWLHLCPGKVFQPALFTNRLKELWLKGCQFMYFGYDKYRSQDPINTLKACLQSEMGVAQPEKHVQVVSQLNSEFSGPTENLYDAMFAPVPFITFSNSPLWPFCFGSAVLETDSRENVRPVKRAQTDSCKVDPVQGLVEAMDVYLRFEGQNH